MSRYAFDPGEALDSALRRILRKQLRSAARAFATEPTPAASVHRARRCLKRSRALLSLIEASHGKRWRLEAQALKAIGKRMGAARDEQAKLDALDRLATDSRTEAVSKRDLARLRRRIEQKRAELEAAIDAEEIAARAVEFDRIGRQFGPKRLADFDRHGLVDGITSAYRAGRRRMRDAEASQADTDFHAWRREVQAHWRHMQLILSCWPAEIGARAETAKQLAALLGEDRDLWLLAGEIAAPDPAIATGALEGLIARIQARQGALRREALSIGHQLYAEKPRQIGRRMARYWKTAATAKTVPARDSGPGRDVREPTTVVEPVAVPAGA